MIRVFATFLGVLALCGCVVIPQSRTVEVLGRFTSSDETFRGSATGYRDGSGDLKVVSNRGVFCSGRYVISERRAGSGVFTCSDNRAGPFQFVTTGLRGNGTGSLNGEPFVFTFGD